MEVSNLIQLIEEFSSTKLSKLELNSELIKKKGLYALKDGAYFLLYPNYLCEEEKNQMNDASNKFKFQNQSTRETYYIGPQYSYGNRKNMITHHNNDSWDTILLKQKAKLELKLETPLNSVLVNRYSQDQHIPYHKDNERCLGNNPVIASLSIGDTGKMVVKNKDDEFIEILIYPGTLLVMFGTFNDHYLHKVERTTNNKKFRINFTFRYIFSNHNNEQADNITHSQNPLQKDINIIKHKLLSLNSQITQSSQRTKESESADAKVVILKCPESIDTTSTQKLMDSINEHLEETSKFSSDLISDISDFRKNNGPIQLSISSLDKKVSLLKLFRENKDFIIRDCLSRQALQLRSAAISLANKGKIEKVWSYKGDVYFTLPGSRNRVLACWDSLYCLGYQGSGFARRK